jgi:hypothetical protein
MSASSVLGGAKPRKAKTKTVKLGKKKSFKIRPGFLHRKLGIPEGTKIPASRLQAALGSPDPETMKAARSAKGLIAMSKKR